MLGSSIRIPISSPVRGINREGARTEQAEGTCWNALNVLPYDRYGRKRVAQRPGNSKAFFNQIGGGTFNQGMLAVNQIVYPGQNFPIPLVRFNSQSINGSGSESAQVSNSFILVTTDFSYVIGGGGGGFTGGSVTLEVTGPHGTVGSTLNFFKSSGVTYGQFAAIGHALSLFPSFGNDNNKGVFPDVTGKWIIEINQPANTLLIQVESLTGIWANVAANTPFLPPGDTVPNTYTIFNGSLSPIGFPATVSLNWTSLAGGSGANTFSI